MPLIQDHIAEFSPVIIYRKTPISGPVNETGTWSSYNFSIVLLLTHGLKNTEVLGGATMMISNPYPIKLDPG